MGRAASPFAAFSKVAMGRVASPFAAFSKVTMGRAASSFAAFSKVAMGRAASPFAAAVASTANRQMRPVEESRGREVEKSRSRSPRGSINLSVCHPETTNRARALAAKRVAPWPSSCSIHAVSKMSSCPTLGSKPRVEDSPLHDAQKSKGPKHRAPLPDLLLDSSPLDPLQSCVAFRKIETEIPLTLFSVSHAPDHIE